MVYNVRLIDSDFRIPAENLDETYQALCNLNRLDWLKQGGRSKNGVMLESWYTGMGSNYPATCWNAEEIFQRLGFSTATYADGSLTLLDFSGRTGQEQVFLLAAAPYVRPGSTLTWQGEDGEVWHNFFDGHTARTRSARLMFDCS